jgi:kynurenine formamidase
MPADWRNTVEGNLADLMASCRLIDLSKRVKPGRASGRDTDDTRKYCLSRFIYAPGEIRHEVVMSNHISTHAEGPAHIMSTAHNQRGKDISEMPVECFYGPAIFVDLKDCATEVEVKADCIRKAGARPGDIVIVGNSRHTGAQRPYLAKDAANYLAELPAKAVGFDDTVFPEDPRVTGKVLEKYYIHDILLSNEIPLIEGLANLAALPCRRFFFFGLPPAMGGLDAFPVRAVALVEEKKAKA